ncbi:peptidylprolyl isomerase [Martelella sp. HB161492]|uniref:peptidylprolyl isomerase n=1 Tax=Martelella sp. HB161492 TaxID=2720726 RepID=UPI00159261DE|nr:peptidylprolyl isomerase [Martelella sp. HB161492]
MKTASFGLGAITAVLIAIGGMTAAPAPTRAATVDIAVIVNNVPVTNDDIRRRAALLRVMGEKGDLNKKAREDMIDQALKQAEIAFRGMSVTTADVDQYYQGFAKANHMTTAQLTQAMNQIGVGEAHFKYYIAITLSWQRIVAARYGQSSTLTDSQFIPQLEALEKEGKKPETTEYQLKRIVFVVPESQRNSLLAKRQREAEQARPKFPGCDDAITFAAGLHDVTVVDVGRYLEPQLPDPWAKSLKDAKGDTGSVFTTPAGAEFLAICSKSVANDDYTARLLLSQKEDASMDDRKKESDAYLKELRDKAQIVTPSK